MEYDFDTVVERRGTNSIKYDFTKEWGKKEDILPLWVADMDFSTAPEILKRLEQVVQHGIFGYSEGKEAYFDAVYRWYKKQFDWEVKRNWLIKTPGVVFAISAAIRAFTREGDGVLIQQPVYYPFSDVITDNNRKLVISPLQLVDGHYEMDFDDFEENIKSNQVKLFILCNPHNPVGRVWKKWELQKVGEICLKYGVMVVSDEIHSDFVYPGHKHLVFASLSPQFADITITCTAPSKTFNLAGLQNSNIFISNRDIRKKFRKAIDAVGYSQVNVMGLTACQAAYEEGEEWLRQLKTYLFDNLEFLRNYIKERIPQVELIEPEGTYLVWLDFRRLGLSEEEREELLANKAKLWLDSGAIFGENGEGFERVNIACPRITLLKALKQLETAIKDNNQGQE